MSFQQCCSLDSIGFARDVLYVLLHGKGGIADSVGPAANPMISKLQHCWKDILAAMSLAIDKDYVVI